jgi:hypothetical protein
MPDANYAVVAGDDNYGIGWIDTYTTSSVRVKRANNSFTLADTAIISAAIFR